MKKNLLVTLLCCFTLVFIFSSAVFAADKFKTDENGVVWVWTNTFGWVVYNGGAIGGSDDGAANPTGIQYGDWFAEPLLALRDAGIMVGDANGHLHPLDNVTRAEFVTLLGRFEGVDVTQYSAHPFTDATANWYTGYVAWAAAEGITNGVSATKFSPNAYITREDLMTMLARYIEEYKDVSLPYDAGTISRYYDDSSIASWAVDAIYSLKAAGIVDGMDEKINGATQRIVKPKGNASRAEAGALIYRLTQSDLLQ